MKNRIEEILAFNQKFVSDKAYETMATSAYPDKKMVVLTCMDTRLTELLPKALNLKNGDAKIVKNAGATIMHPFGSIVRSILVAVYEFEVEDVLVIGHYHCGMSQLNSEKILTRAIERGIDPDTLNMLRNSGIDIDGWLNGFDSPEAAVCESVSRLRKHPLMPTDVRIHGFLMHPETGELIGIHMDM